MRVIIVAAALSACSAPSENGPDETPGTTDPPSSPAALQSPTCAVHTVVPAIFDCTWTTVSPATGFVEYWLEDEPEVVRSTPRGLDGTSHDVAVLGLKAGRTYQYRAVVEGAGGRSESTTATHVVPDVPAGFADLTLTEYDPERSLIASGYLLLAVVHIQGARRFTEVLILDGEADPVWWVESVDNGLSATPTLSRDGRSVRFLTTDQTWDTDLGTITRISLDGDEVEETRAMLGHHAMIENSDGTLTWISFDYATIDGVDWAADALRTAPEGIGDEHVPIVEFAWFDAYPEDPWEDVPGQDDEVRYGTGIEWTHTNSLMAIDDEFFYLNAKNVDAILKVDRSDGSIVWQLNGPYGDFTHPNGSAVWRAYGDLDLFSHAHMSHLWDGGMVVFDNGDLSHDPPVSRAVEYVFDEDAFTVEQVWEYVEPDLKFTGAMGDVRKLDNGNYIIAWSSLEYIHEVTPDGDTVWQIEMSGVGTFARVVHLTDIYPP